MGAQGLVPHARDGDARRGWGMRGETSRWGRGALVSPALVPGEDQALTAASSLSGDIPGKEEAAIAWRTEGRGDRRAGAALGTIVTL